MLLAKRAEMAYLLTQLGNRANVAPPREAGGGGGGGGGGIGGGGGGGGGLTKVNAPPADLARLVESHCTTDEASVMYQDGDVVIADGVETIPDGGKLGRCVVVAKNQRSLGLELAVIGQMTTILEMQLEVPPGGGEGGGGGQGSVHTVAVIHQRQNGDVVYVMDGHPADVHLIATAPGPGYAWALKQVTARIVSYSRISGSCAVVGVKTEAGATYEVPTVIHTNATGQMVVCQAAGGAEDDSSTTSGGGEESKYGVRGGNFMLKPPNGNGFRLRVNPL